MSEFIQYGKQTIEECDLEAVIEVFRENKYLTTGPRVAKFEQAVCDMIGVKYAFAVNSGTAALHCATRAIRLKSGDEVIVPAITFAASANCALFEGATPVFCDVDPETLNIDIEKAEQLVNKNTKAIVAVDYAGQPPNYHDLRKLCDKHDLVLIEDAAHSIGHKIDFDSNGDSVCPARKYVGSYADMTTYSFHPVKNMTTGEGGMIVTNNDEYAKRIKTFRTHGISTEHNERKLHGYDIVELGFNYRLTDFQCALGLSQLKRVSTWVARRQEIAKKYDQAFKNLDNGVSDLLRPLANKTSSCHHIYVILLELEKLDCDRDIIFAELKDKGIGVNVHYIPVYWLSYYKDFPHVKSERGLCPVAEDAYMRMITIPLFPTMTEEQIDKVINEVCNVISNHRR
tara:strand:+ start:9066 stop:10262 length:1197 start_codon:yes stop_codon:yes gene_type:complete